MPRLPSTEKFRREMRRHPAQESMARPWNMLAARRMVWSPVKVTSWSPAGSWIGEVISIDPDGRRTIPEGATRTRRRRCSGESVAANSRNRNGNSNTHPSFTVPLRSPRYSTLAYRQRKGENSPMDRDSQTSLLSFAPQNNLEAVLAQYRTLMLKEDSPIRAIRHQPARAAEYEDIPESVH